jgi:hypothetical protein
MSKDPPIGLKPWKKNHTSLSWSAAGTDSLRALVAGITDSGNAVMFSRTMDGSALVLSVFSGDTKSKEFVTEPGDIPSLFHWALETYS